MGGRLFIFVVGGCIQRRSFCAPADNDFSQARTLEQGEHYCKDGKKRDQNIYIREEEKIKNKKLTRAIMTGEKNRMKT